nr:alpha/beta fold hydrolase [Serratia marcescens]
MHIDDDLTRFAALGAPPLPPGARQGYIDHDGARIWYAAYGDGPAVILLHGGLGHSGNWGYQLPALRAAGYGVLLIDSRGHGRSTRDARPYRYDRMADDLLAVMAALQIPHAALAGWSDGACVALIAAHQAPGQVDGVFSSAAIWTPAALNRWRPARSSSAVLRAMRRTMPPCRRRRTISRRSSPP